MKTQPDSQKPASGFLKIMRHFWPQIHGNRFLLAWAFAALLVEISMYLLEPWPLKFIFDRVIAGNPAGGSLRSAVMDNLPPMTLIILAAAATVIFTGIRAACAYLSTVGFALVGNRLMTKVRNDLYNHIQCLPLSFHTKARTGDLLVRVISDVGFLQEVLVTAAMPLFGHTLALGGMLAVMFWLNWQLALAALLVFPLFCLIVGRQSRRIREVARKQRHIQSSMAAVAVEAVSAIKTVQALSLEDTFSRNFAANSDKSLKTEVKAKRLEAGMERTVDILIALATAIAISGGGFLVIRHRLTPGELLVFLAYFKHVFHPLSNFAKYAGRLSKASASAERIVDLFELTPQIRDLPGAIAAGPFKGEVQFKDVDFSYEAGKSLLKDITFILPAGRHACLIAPSGFGKTTLASLIMRLYEPKSGQVLIDGKDIRSYSIDSLRSQISVVLQDTLLFAATVSENIVYGAIGASQEEIEAAARLANAHDFIMAMPDGYNTVLGERGVTLSQGQRQRIAIARAAIRKSPILIFDEPTVNLDRENERELNCALEKLAFGRTMFLITHDPAWTEKVDVVFCLTDGHLTARPVQRR